MIVDHDKSRKAGRVMTLDRHDEGDAEQTMAIRAVVPVQPISGDPGEPVVNHAALERRRLGAKVNSGGNGGDYKPWPIPEDGEGDEVAAPPIMGNDNEQDESIGGTSQPDPGRLPRPRGELGESVKNWRGPFPVRRRNLHPGRQPLPDENPKGVEHETGTHAIAAITKATGKPPERMDLHRTAQRIQWAFNQAGWSVAVWYGEHTKEFWVMDESGLHGGFKDVTALYSGMGWQAL